MSKKDKNLCIVTIVLGLAGVFFYFVLGDKFSGSIIMTATMFFIFNAIFNIFPKLSDKTEDKDVDGLLSTNENENDCSSEEDSLPIKDTDY